MLTLRLECKEYGMWYRMYTPGLWLAHDTGADPGFLKKGRVHLRSTSQKKRGGSRKGSNFGPNVKKWAKKVGGGPWTPRIRPCYTLATYLRLTWRGRPISGLCMPGCVDCCRNFWAKKHFTCILIVNTDTHVHTLKVGINYDHCGIYTRGLKLHIIK